MIKIKVPVKKPRNPLVPFAKIKTGAGRHKNKKREDRNKHQD